ncbi:hypothetical protein NHX12_013636 [Muraenolepis orangiensis]|uniref:Prospero domain-containing protein n=1 Tax=Muraenolepis orangiensis TaxID=630683 RepID=A0A9Q0DC60_9TELE|nr:hypothetical protein NHX12_013636 [Muraenolepis orangiensis]
MDSPTDLYDDSAHQMRAYTSSSTPRRTPDLLGHRGGAAPPSGTPELHLMHHLLLQSAGSAHRPGMPPPPPPPPPPAAAAAAAVQHTTTTTTATSSTTTTTGQPGSGRTPRGEGGLRRRCGAGAALVAEWRRDVLRSKRLRQRGNALQEKVWRAFGEKHGGPKFAQALKVELGSAVARVIDRVLRLYAEAGDECGPPSPPASIAFLLPSDRSRASRQQLMKTSGPCQWPYADLRPRQSHDPNKHKAIPLLQGPPFGHLHPNKAKLMFFYARYPSSNTLKTYFPDVKFNRCVTSQLIKWFSNFREFFYIQMERFARQAVREALARDGSPLLGGEGHLRMSRDTELYRILNMHYNKSNVYQVPEKFVEVAEVALREFYSAIHHGRDSDPCWKKGIYKIICKLDSPVPDPFRLPGCPVG